MRFKLGCSNKGLAHLQTLFHVFSQWKVLTDFYFSQRGASEALRACNLSEQVEAPVPASTMAGSRVLGGDGVSVEAPITWQHV